MTLNSSSTLKTPKCLFQVPASPFLSCRVSSCVFMFLFVCLISQTWTLNLLLYLSSFFLILINNNATLPVILPMITNLLGSSFYHQERTPDRISFKKEGFIFFWYEGTVHHERQNLWESEIHPEPLISGEPGEKNPEFWNSSGFLCPAHQMVLPIYRPSFSVKLL